jgi:hypothetical protein
MPRIDTSLATDRAPSAERLLAMARSERAEDRQAVAALEPKSVAEACNALEATACGELLNAIENPEQVVPLLSEARLALAINAYGKDEAGWLLEFSTEEQRVACIDMDCFDPEGFCPERMVGWIDALIESGWPTLTAAFEDFDPEVWVLALRSMATFSIGAAGGDTFTEDGVVFYTPNSEEDFDRVREILQSLIHSNPRRYWQFAYGALEGASAECEQWAVRWREARLADLGFPDREYAMRAYRPLSSESVEFRAPAPYPSSDDTPESALVAARLAQTLLGDALRRLPADRATELLGYVAGVANSLAVADRLELGDPESARSSGEKALNGIERGLREMMRNTGLAAHQILDRVTPMDLFRVGVTAEPDLSGRRRG